VSAILREDATAWQALALALFLPLQSSTLRVVVTADGGPVAAAQVVVAGATTLTDRDGAAVLPVAAGTTEITIVK
jgi:hypothetical protein